MKRARTRREHPEREQGAIVEKDARLLAAVADLLDRFGDAVELVDHWDADLLAIGISRRGERTRLVYVSMLPDQEARFGVALEISPRVGADLPYEDGGWHRGLTLSEVTGVATAHLGLS
jgi:hypothetical protein